MKHLVLCVVVVLGLAVPVFAKEQGRGHGKGHGMGHVNEMLSDGQSDAASSEMRPPGLSKQDKMPKGLEKKGKIPKGWSKGKKKGWKKDRGTAESE